MQCYTELTAPTAVTHSLCVPFLSSLANNLIVVKTSLLQIFSLKSIVSKDSDKIETVPTSAARDSTTARGERLNTTKLVLVAQYELSGTVTSLARVKILRSKSGGEALLVALRDAKLSLVEWDPERYSISTISIHYYEREDILGSPWEPDLSECINYLSVDPSSRCAALKFGTRHLAILPFHQAGDDLVMDDYDAEIDGDRSERKASITDGGAGKTPYASSFVLSLLALDPTLTHPIHLSFLHEYREPTFGILYSQFATSTALLHERRDKVSYAVYTLDLEQRASTTLLSVNELPYDLRTIVPLSRVIGGALLVGCNEMIHIDQSGKTNGVAVNDLAKMSTNFVLSDQSDLDMKLEGCVVKQLGSDTTDLLLILNTGELSIISFKIDGRSVSGFSIRRVSADDGGHHILAGASCASYIGRGRMFIGSEDADSTILGWSRKTDRLKRQRTRANLEADDLEDVAALDEDDIDDDDDDLYAGDMPEERAQNKDPLSSRLNVADEYVFRVHDSMANFGPMNDVAFVSLPNKDYPPAISSESSFELTVTSGRGRAGGLTSFQRILEPEVIEQYSIPEAQAVWTVSTKKTQEDSSHHDNYIIASHPDPESDGTSRAYSLNPIGLSEVKDTDFDPDAGMTVDVGTLNGGTRVVQVLRSELRTFDGDFGLAQIFPLTDEDSDEEQPKVVRASFLDPYVLVIKDDSSVIILTADENGDLDEVEQGEPLREGKWSSGYLYEDSNDNFRLEFGEDSEDEAGNVLMFLLSAVGGLHVYRLPSLQKSVYIADGLSFLPPFLSKVFTIRRSSARETIKEILVTDLGDSTQKSPYLILRSARDDLIIYQPYQAPVEGSKDTTLRFYKISSLHLPKASAEDSLEEEQSKSQQPLRAIHNLDIFSAVFMPGVSPSLIIKPASSLPQIIDMAGGPVRWASPLQTSKCENGFVYVDSKGNATAAQLPPQSQYTTGWVTRSAILGEEVHALSYHAGQQAYVIGTSYKTPFKLPEDETHSHWANEEISFLPQIDHGSVKLLDRQTCSIIDKYDLDPTEIITCIETIPMEMSENTHERADIVAVGTGLIRGEDLPATGRIYIFSIIDVVPEPEHPETGRSLKLIAKEEVKGAVTAVSGVGTQGFLLAAQGQKCMVRGLKEDGTLLPVAFMDMQCHVSVAKELEGTGMCLMGDAIKGIWFTGYTEDPYQLRLFGKSPYHIEVMAADFLPDGKQLYIVVADADCNLHILQFDPEHPKSLSGTRLLPHTTFHTSHFSSTLTLLPSTSTPASTSTPSSVLLTSPTGSLSLLTTLPPSTHRTLSSLQSHLQNTLPHPLGLNPRSFRMPSSGVGSGDGGMGRGGVIDGNVVRRWNEGGSWRRWGGEEVEIVESALRVALGDFC